MLSCSSDALHESATVPHLPIYSWLLAIGYFSGFLLSAPAADTFPIPAPSDILARLQQGHPRLLASSNDFLQLRARISANAQLQSWHKDLQARAEQIIAAAPSRYE